MTENQILLGMGAIASLMLSLLSLLFFLRWPCRWWRSQVLFWGCTSGGAIALLILISLSPTLFMMSNGFTIPQNPTFYAWTIIWSFWNITQYQKTQKGEPRRSTPKQPNPQRPVQPTVRYTQGGDLINTHRGKPYRNKPEQPPEPSPHQSLPPSSDPPLKKISFRWPLKPSEEGVNMPPGDLPPRKKFDSAVASARLMYKLDALTHDRAASERLVANLLEKHPGRSPDWAADKAIYDLTRDRH